MAAAVWFSKRLRCFHLALPCGSCSRERSQRCKKDAARAFFDLSIYQGNKAKAVRVGVVSPLMQLLLDPSAGMVDEALAILAISCKSLRGKISYWQCWCNPNFGKFDQNWFTSKQGKCNCYFACIVHN